MQTYCPIVQLDNVDAGEIVSIKNGVATLDHGETIAVDDAAVGDYIERRSDCSLKLWPKADFEKKYKLAI